MRFLTLRHMFDTKHTFGSQGGNTHVGPYSPYSLRNGSDIGNAVKAISWVNGYQPASSIDDKHNSCGAYGFISWEQFDYYWGDDARAFAHFTAANFVVYEYDIPDKDIFVDETQAVAFIHRYEPITSYVLGYDEDLTSLIF